MICGMFTILVVGLFLCIAGGLMELYTNYTDCGNE